MVETVGTVRMRGETGAGLRVRVRARERRLTLLSGDEVVGDWATDEIGIQSLHEGFAIRAEGEELVLVVEDDVAVAEELGLVAASPRLARRVAASHNPDRPLPEDPEAEPPRPSLTSLALSLAGAMILIGGALLRMSPERASSQTSGPVLWLSLAVGGLLLIAGAYLIIRGRRWARTGSWAVLAAVVGAFAVSAGGSSPDVSHITAHAFVAGGIVIGVAVLAGGEASDGQ